MKRPHDMGDLFALSSVAESKAPERTRMPGTGAVRPIHISGYDRKVHNFFAAPD